MNSRILAFKTYIGYVVDMVKSTLTVAKKEIIILSLIEVISIPIPLVQAYLAKLIMDQISLSIQGTAVNVELVIFYLFLELLTVLFPIVLDFFGKVSSNLLDMKTTVLHSQRFFAKIKEIDLVVLEAPEFQNNLQEIRFGGGISTKELMSNFFTIARGLFILFSFFGLLLTHNVYIAILLVISSSVSFYINFITSKKRIAFYKSSRWGTRLMWYLEHMLYKADTAKEIKALNVYENLESKHRELKTQELTLEKQLDTLNEKKQIASTSFAKIIYYFSYGWIVLATLKGHLSLGEMTMVMMLYAKSQDGLSNVFSSFVRFYESNAKLKTLFDFLRLPTLQPESLSKEEMNSMTSNFDIVFEDVSFSYGNDRKIIDKLNLKISTGTKLALVGENGAGKSTLIKLLLGLYQPTEGRITIGGFDIKRFSREQLKQVMGVVFQDFLKVLGTSVQDNVKLGHLLSSNEEYEKAKEHSGMPELLNKLQANEKSVLGKHFSNEGLELSGGQWQKIALARGFIQPGSILILDEPTSAIDAKTEYEIFEQVQKLTQGKTTVLVSHRFSTVRTADLIVYLDHGKIIESGTHEQLIAQNGQYAHLFNLQARGYR